VGAEGESASISVCKNEPKRLDANCRSEQEGDN